jgi:hypothetical protein
VSETLCVACGEQHFETDEELARAIRVGISRVHPDCAWTLRYPGQTANAVIMELERKLDNAGSGGVPPAEPPADEDPPVAAALPPEPDDRVEANAFIEEVLCSVCGGDGEVRDPEDAESFNECARCNGVGRVKVTAA